MSIVLLTATVLAVLITVLPIWRFEVWWIRAFDFPRLQFAIAFVVIVLLQLALLPLDEWLTWLQILSVVLCLVYQLAWIIRYTPFLPVEVEGSRTHDRDRMLQLMTANVLMPNRNADALLRIVRELDPDLLIAIESDAWWQSRLDALEHDYPHTVKCPLDNLYGMHLYSKLELSDVQLEYLVEDDKPSIHCSIELRSGDRVRGHFLHPAPPSPTENVDSGERDAELLMVARSVSQRDEPTIVAGDLNDVAWSETTQAFRKISRLLDPRRGRGMFNTYHAKHRFLRWPLDHLFHSDHFTLAGIHRTRSYGSDHFALFTQLVYRPRFRDQQEVPSPVESDIELARRKQNDQNVDPSDVPAPGK